LGVPPSKLNEVIGIAKAYCTRVGSGPFPTELNNEVGEKIRSIGMEFGATTGRPRRCGWIDIPQLVYTIMLNGVTQIVITKMDVLNTFEEIFVGESYNLDGVNTLNVPFDLNDADLTVEYQSYEGWNTDLKGINVFDNLPIKAKNYLAKLETLLKTKISMVSTGPDRLELIEI
jgi:adenylosuccinate synthase